MSIEKTFLSKFMGKRKVERLRRRRRVAETIRRYLEAGGEYVSKRDKTRLAKEKLQRTLYTGIKLCIDCSFEAEMSSKVFFRFLWSYSFISLLGLVILND